LPAGNATIPSRVFNPPGNCGVMREHRNHSLNEGGLIAACASSRIAASFGRQYNGDSRIVYVGAGVSCPSSAWRKSARIFRSPPFHNALL
jgi:hypothetical protein